MVEGRCDDPVHRRLSSKEKCSTALDMVCFIDKGVEERILCLPQRFLVLLEKGLYNNG
jgi:hypothetical protein